MKQHWCPDCGYGWVVPIRIIAIDQIVFTCDECDATWLFEDDIGNPKAFVTLFTDFMEKHGLPPFWSELEELPIDGSIPEFEKRTSPLVKTSPDGNLELLTFWRDSKAKTIRMRLYEPRDAHRNVRWILETAPEFSVPNVEDCARWEGNDTFIIQGEHAEYVWRKQADGTWKRQD